jgi:hypothetical protein
LEHLQQPFRQHPLREAQKLAVKSRNIRLAQASMMGFILLHTIVAK